MPEEKKGRNPRVSKAAETPQCHVHDKVLDYKIEQIRENVCVNDEPLTKHTDGNHYCLFHLPIKEKDAVKLEEIFWSRLNSVDEGLVAVEKLPPEKREAAKNGIYHDFRYVWFPLEINLANYKFEVYVDFSSAAFSAKANFGSATFSVKANFTSATFSAKANFISATFSGKANFRSARFSADADFSSAAFSSDADFKWAAFSSDADFKSAAFFDSADFGSATFLSNASFTLATFSAKANFISAAFSEVANFHSAIFLVDANFQSVTFSEVAYFTLATFSAGADFKSATFSADAKFGSATFSAYAFFNSATFSADANFSSAKFEETSQISCRQTSFQGIADFSEAVVKGYLYFEAGKGVKRETSVFEDRLKFAQVRVDKPERISFDKVRLRPGWIVNVDSRKFVFTDIRWENHKARKPELEEELKSLVERKYEEPHNYRLLTVAFRNLAANAEEFNRYEEASSFRKSAFECERFERIYKQKKWRRESKEKKKKSFSEHWKRLKEARFDFVNFLYRWLSNYGESWLRAFLWLIFIWIFFALVYKLFGMFGGDGKFPMDFLDAVSYSLQVMTLQKPEPRPYGWITYILYGFETIFAPLQAALLALAIRRKFMR